MLTTMVAYACSNVLVRSQMQVEIQEHACSAAWVPLHKLRCLSGFSSCCIETHWNLKQQTTGFFVSPRWHEMSEA